MITLRGQFLDLIEGKNNNRMPILADLSRKFNLLTTDAKPDPPRVHINDDSIHASASNSDGTPSTSNIRENATHSNDLGDTLRKGQNTTKDSGKNANSRPKKASHSGQAKNIVNYNIVNSSGVKIGGTTTYVCNINQYGKSPKETEERKSPTRPKPSTKLMPESVKTLSTSKEELTMKYMFLIKTHIDNRWRDIFTSLGYSKGQLDQFEESHKSKGIDEMIYQILLDWKRENGKDAQVGVIVKILWEYEQYDCAERLAAAHKL